MKNKTFWIGFVVVFIVMQAIGFLIHGVMLDDMYQALAASFRPKEQMDAMMWIMILSGTVVLFLFCYVYTKGHEGKGVMEGVRYGALMGLFLALPTSVDAYVLYPLTQELAVIWFVTTVVSMMIAGAIFAAIYKPSAD
ncbi:MAG: hypothetical protein IID59_08110 [Proteobacteria bacterium]|nr:hypothetical protein [Pseudomonadota bacterium]